MKNYESMTDEMLALQYVGGDNGAFDELLTRNQKKLYDYIMFVVRDPELANDVFQETFVKVITRLQEGKYTDSGKFSFWLIRIAHNVIMDTFRLQKSVHQRQIHHRDLVDDHDVRADGIRLVPLEARRFAVVGLAVQAPHHRRRIPRDEYRRFHSRNGRTFRLLLRRSDLDERPYSG